MMISGVVEQVEVWFIQHWPDAPFDATKWYNGLATIVSYTADEVAMALDNLADLDRPPFPSEVAHGLARTRQKAKVATLIEEARQNLVGAATG